MSGAAFLALPIVVAVVWSVALWLRTRKPTTLGSSIDSFEREMRALAPDRDGVRDEVPPAPEPTSGFRTLDGGELIPAPLDDGSDDDSDRAAGEGRG